MYMSALEPSGTMHRASNRRPARAWIAVAGEIHEWNGCMVSRPGDRIAHQTSAVCAALAAC